MKKIFTLFAVALLGLCAYAQEATEEPCPSKMEMTVLDGSDAANVTFEFGLAQVNSDNLNGFNMEVTKPEGASWKRAQGTNYVNAKPYARYILGMIDLDGMTIDDFTDADLNDMIGDLLDNKSNVKDGNLVFIQILSTNDCRFYPNEPGKVGVGKIDMSTLEDGEYELKADATPSGCSFSYTGGPEGTRAWTADEPVVLKLKKEGNTVTEVQTAITTINTDQAVDNRIFDIQGRELKSVPEHGIYIQNGKKYVK